MLESWSEIWFQLVLNSNWAMKLITVLFQHSHCHHMKDILSFVFLYSKLHTLSAWCACIYLKCGVYCSGDEETERWTWSPYIQLILNFTPLLLYLHRKHQSCEASLKDSSHPESPHGISSSLIRFLSSLSYLSFWSWLQIWHVLVKKLCVTFSWLHTASRRKSSCTFNMLNSSAAEKNTSDFQV